MPTIDVFHVAARRLMTRIGVTVNGVAAPDDDVAAEIAKDLRGAFAYACDRFAAPLQPENFMSPCPPPESGNYKIVNAVLTILKGGLERGAIEARTAGATEFPPRA